MNIRTLPGFRAFTHGLKLGATLLPGAALGFTLAVGAGSPALAHGTPVHTDPTPSTITYEFVTDPVAAGDLDTYYSDNWDYEADHSDTYCSITQVNVSAYGPDALLIQCTVPTDEAPDWVKQAAPGPGSPTEYRPVHS